MGSLDKVNKNNIIFMS